MTASLCVYVSCSSLFVAAINNPLMNVVVIVALRNDNQVSSLLMISISIGNNINTQVRDNITPKEYNAERHLIIIHTQISDNIPNCVDLCQLL